MTSTSDPTTAASDATAAGAKKPSAGGKVVLWTLLGVVALAALAYVGAYAVAGEKVPRGASVAGVEIGGLTPAAAEQRLRDALVEREAAPIRVAVDEETETVTPDEVGFAVDYQASVEEAGAGRSWAPGRIWEYFTGGEDHDAVLTVDQAALDGVLDGLAERVDVAPVEGAIVFEQAQPQPISPEAGQSLDREGATEALQAAYLSEETAELPVAEEPAAVDEQAVRDALESFAKPAMSGPVVVVFDGDTEVRLRPRAYADALSVQTVDGELTPQLDEQAFLRGIRPAMRTIGRRPADASFEVVDGEPRVVPARRGVTFDSEQLTSQFLDHVAATGDERRLEIDAVVEQPEFTTADARALGIVEEVSSFTTNFPYAEYRNVNLGRAAELIDGYVLEPGETFSLNDTVGERTAENGFTRGFIISDGIFKEDFGGGVSQIATTTFNAAFFAGLEDVEHKPHSFYIDRYPVGREATVAWGAVDLRFRNDTDYGVLIKASVRPSTPSSQGAATVTMYSTKVWDITTDTSARYNFTQPETRYIQTSDCVSNTGYGGFDIDVFRYFRRAGQSELVRTERFNTTYIPSDTVVCGPPPGAQQEGQQGGGGRRGGGDG